MDWLQERRHEVDWGKHVHPTFAWGCSRDWCKSGEFLRGRGSVRFGWSFTSQSLPYVNFKVAILEAAYKWKWFWIEILDTWQWLPQFSMSYCPLNDTSVNGVTSLISLVSHMYTHGLREAYPEIYQLACILLNVPVSSAGCEQAFSKLCFVKDELRSTMGDDRDSTVSCWWQLKRA